MNKKVYIQTRKLFTFVLLTLCVVPAWSAIDPIHAQKLLAVDGTTNDFFGHTISISGDTAVIGNKSRVQREAYIYTRTGNTWSQQAILTPSDGEASFGSDVAIDGDTVVVGATHGDFPPSMGGGGYPGNAYVFTRSAGSWSQQAILNASDPKNADDFGYSVSISGDTILVSAATKIDNAGAFGPGAVYVYTGSGSSWSQQAKLIPSDGAALGRFGLSVSLSGDTALIGSQTNTTSNGLSYIFTRSGTSWNQQTQLAVSGSSTAGSSSVSLHDGTAVIGDHQNSSAYVFTGSGASWSQQAKLTPAGGGGYSSFGGRVSVSGDTVLVGDSSDNSAYIFTRSSTTWSPPVRLTTSDGITDNGYGFDVAVFGETAFIGAASDSTNGAYSGAVYIHGQAFTVGGTVTGLAAGTSMVLQNNAGDDLSVSGDGDGSFTFSTPVGDGYGYNVTVLTQPTNPNQECTVGDGSGMISGSNINNVSVSCVNMYSIGGEVSGLTVGNSVVLQNNGGDDLTVNNNGSFTFATLLGDASPYSTTILTQAADPKLSCFLSRNSGMVSSANVIDIGLDCFPNLDVTPSSTGNGTISPSMIVENIPQGSSTQFTLVPGPNYVPDWMTGTCPTGTKLNNNDGTWTYTTGAITEDCTVIANFQPGIPVITEGDSIEVIMDEDAAPIAFDLSLNATDPNNDILTWSISGNPDKGTATVNGTGLSMAVDYMPSEDEYGSDSFEVQVSDGEYTDTIVVNVTINSINDAPVFSHSIMEYTDGVAEVGQIVVSDVDNDPDALNFNLTGGVDWLLFSLTDDGVLSFKSPPDTSIPGDDDTDNKYEITVQVDDGIDTTEQDITVLPGNCTYYVVPALNGHTVVFCL